jgi:dihydrofolate reductase
LNSVICDLLARAQEATAGKDVAVTGGAETARQYLTAGLIDELRLHIAPLSALMAPGSCVLGGGTDPVQAGGRSDVQILAVRTSEAHI